MRTSLATLPRTLGARFSAEFVGPPLPPIDPGPELLERLREVRRSEVPGLGRGGAEVSDGMLPALAAVGRRPEAKAEVGEDDAIGGLDWSGLDWRGWQLFSVDEVFLFWPSNNNKWREISSFSL